MKKKPTKDLVIGLGEIGMPLYKLLSKSRLTVGIDIVKSKMNLKKIAQTELFPTEFMHVCIPFTKNFQQNVIGLFTNYKPKVLVIHSTIKPLTTEKIQKALPVPVIYSPTRGVHRRMIKDLKRYTKFYALGKNSPNSKWAIREYEKTLKKAAMRSKKMSSPRTLELAKIIVDTSYYGWLITYSQISNLIAKRYQVDYEEMWSFADEIQKYLGNRPKMFPGYIGGHCVIPNLVLVDNTALDLIKHLNTLYTKKVKNAKTIDKRYRNR